MFGWMRLLFPLALKYFSDYEYWKEYFPAEFVIEMKEQFDFWFTFAFMSTVLEDCPPYEQVGTHGMVVDRQNDAKNRKYDSF